MTPDREACDRCHSTKTRCVKAKRPDVCIRCERLGVSCHYSPAGRTGRPLGSRKRKYKTSPATGRETFERQEGDACSHNKVSSFRENEQSITSDSRQDGLIADMDFYSLLSCTENDSLSTFLVDDFAREERLATSVSESVEFSTGWSFKHLPTDQSSQVDIDGGPRLASTPLMVLESVDVLQKLVDIQLGLRNLVRSLSTSGNIPENVEDIYRIIETLTSVLAELGGVDSARRQRTASPLNGAAVLLFSSCYCSLIVACEHFVHLLRLDLQGLRDSDSDNLSSPTWCPGPQSGSPAKAPAISVGAFRLEMPRRAVAEIHFQLIKQTLQHLQSSMERQYHDSFAGQLPISGARTQNNEEDGDSLHTHSIKLNALAGLVETGLDDLLQKENNLNEKLGIGASKN